MQVDNQALDESQFESGYNAQEPAAVPEPAKEPEAKPAEQKEEKSGAIDPVKALFEKVEKLEARTRNAEGHIGGLNHQQKLMQETLQAASKAATKQVDDAPTQAQVKEAMTDPQEWAALKTSYPEWAKATEQIIDAKVKAQPGFDPAAVDKIVAERVAAETADVRKEMIDSHLDGIVDGDWNAEVKSEKFAKWFEGQSEAIKALGGSKKMTDAAKMLRLYEASKKAPPAPDPAKEKEVSARQKRFEAAVNPRGAGGHAVTSSDLDDFEAGYNGR